MDTRSRESEKTAGEPPDESASARPPRDDDPDTEPSTVSDEKLLELLSRSADLACIVATDGYFRWVAPAWTRILGWSEDQLLSRPFGDFVHPADVDKTVEAVSGAFDGDDIEGVDNRYRTTDDEYRVIQWNSMGVGEDESLLFAIGRDVTEERRRQALLEERARMMAMTEDIAGIGHWWADLRTRRTTFTRVVREIYGLGPDEPAPPIEKGIEWYHDDDRAMVRGLVEGAIEDGMPYEFRARILRPDGTLVWVESAGAGDRDDDGDVVGIYGIIRDVTEQVELERRLRHAEKMASLGTISAGVAHEINNPLTWLRGNLDLLRGRLEDLEPSDFEAARGDLLELARSSLDGGERIARIVRGLRAFSHAGGARERLRVAQLIDTAVALIQNEVRHHARLECEVDESLEIVGDETQLVQVLVNVLANAAQAIPPGRSSVERISLTASPDAEGGTRIEITDTGSGIPDDQLSRVWDPFFTTKAVGEGTGLGLAVVHSLVKRHGGEISIESVLGEGTTVTIRLPRVAPHEVGRVAATGTARAFDEEREPDLGSMLVVDDEPAIVALVERCVADAMRVHTATGGAEAIGILETRDDIDVVCCDMMMPDVSGMEVWKWAERNRPRLLPRIIMITGGVFTEEARSFIAEHDPALLEKPFSVEEFRERLRALV